MFLEDIVFNSPVLVNLWNHMYEYFKALYSVNLYTISMQWLWESLIQWAVYMHDPSLPSKRQNLACGTGLSKQIISSRNLSLDKKNSLVCGRIYLQGTLQSLRHARASMLKRCFTTLKQFSEKQIILNC